MKTWATIFVLSGLFSPNTGVYKKHTYVQKSMTWTDAQAYCREHYDDLSTVSNSEITFLSLNSKITFEYYWIGLHRDSQKPSVWRWTGGEEATDVPWQVGQPDTLHELCVAIAKSSNKAYDSACFLSLPFYCMEHFELILEQEGSTWDEALQYCRQNYMDMALLTSEVAMVEARNKSAPALTDDVWMALRFILGQWLWANGKSLVYKAWSEEESQCPAVDQRCGVLNVKKMVWKPANCGQRLNFLCVKRNKKKASGESED